MNFCQKHQNHHCIHSHNCTNHDHKKSHKNRNKSSEFIKPTIPRKPKQLKKIIQVNQEQLQCHFNSNQNTKLLQIYKDCSNCKKLHKSLQQKTVQLQQLKKLYADLQKKNRQTTQQNRQFQGVIQYYRSQIDRIVKCSQADIKNQIKKHIKQNSQLSVRNKFLSNKLNQVQDQLAAYQKLCEENKKIITILKQDKDKITLAYNSLLQKYSIHKNEQQQKSKQNQKEKKKANQNQQKYQIVMKQTNILFQNIKKQNTKLANQSKQLKSKLEIVNQKLSNQIKLFKIEQEAAKDRQTILKKNVERYQKQINQLKNNVGKLQHKLKMKQQQLALSKKLIEKQLNLNKQNKQLFQHINKNQNKDQKQNIQKQSILKQNTYKFSYQNQKKTQIIIEQLNKQITNLKQKLAAYQKIGKNKNLSIQNIEEYILTIGASQAFKRIIQQKNQFIKKLIKEKQTLLHKIT